MTVKDLMSRLATFDPDALVVLSDADGYEVGPLAGLDEGQYDGKRVYSSGTPLVTGAKCLIFYPVS